MTEYENDILKDREKSYGNPVVMHERIARIWSAILNSPVSAYEVALCMTGLKLARATKNASDPDSLIDAHGYTEIAQTIQAEFEKEDYSAFDAAKTFGGAVAYYTPKDQLEMDTK